MGKFWQVGGVLFILVSGARSATSVQGRVLDTNCSGASNLVVKFLPPKASNLAAVVTVTEDDGSFNADLPAASDYYVSVYLGTQQLYGRVVTLDGDNPLIIVLKAKEGTPQSACNEQPRSKVPPSVENPSISGIDSHVINDALQLGRSWAKKNSKPGSIKLGGLYQDFIDHSHPSIWIRVSYLTDRAVMALSEMRAERLGKSLADEEIRLIPRSGLFNVLLHVDEELSSEKSLPMYLGRTARAELRFKAGAVKPVDLNSPDSPAYAEWIYISKLFGDLGEPIGGPEDETVQVGYKTKLYLKFSFAHAPGDWYNEEPLFVLINSQGREDKVRIFTQEVR